MTSAVRAEILKLRTARLPWGLLALTVALTSLHALLFDSNDGGTGHASIPSLAALAGQQEAINIPGELLLLATVLGIIVASGEFRHRTATSTYLATPVRVRVLGAKAMAAASVGLIFGLAGAAAATAIGLAFTAAGGHHLVVSGATIARYATGAAVGSALLAAAGVAAGSLVRSQVAAIIGTFVWGFVIEQSVGGIYTSAARYLPYTAAAAMAGTRLGSETTPLPFAGAAALLVGVVAVISLIAARTAINGDIT